MGDEPSRPFTHAEQRELDALRRRAYGPDADLFDDAAALARLGELEDRITAEFAPSTSRVEPPREAEPPDHGAPRPEPAVVLAAPAGAVGPRVPRWHTALVAAAAAVALILGGSAWSVVRVDATASLPSGDAKTEAISNQQRSLEYEVGYGMYLDRLRDDVFALPGIDRISDRLIRDQLRPYGILYGRTVASGPTTDRRFCMIIAEAPQSSVSCISVDNAYANPLSVTLPAWRSDPAPDPASGPRELVTYTLMPGGSVIALPAEPAD